MADDLVRQVYNGQRNVIKHLQQPLSGGVVYALFGVVSNQARQLLLVLFEFAPHNKLNQGEQSYGDAQQVGQPDDLVVAFDEQRV